MLALTSLLALAGGLVTVLTSVPFTVPLVISVLWIFAQYLAGPWFIQWLVPATELTRGPDGYLDDHPLARIVERQCCAAGVPLVRLGLIDDGTPNAFAFGRTRRDARIWISRGLVERLDERELEAVVAHEVGHVANRDFIVMTIAAIIPMLLYYVYIGARGNNRADAVVVSVSAYIGFLLAQLAVLALSRAREYGADHASCARTGDGDALCSALVKIAYGIGQVNRERQTQVRLLQQSKRRKEARRLERQGHRLDAVRPLGIAGSSGDEAMLDAHEAGLDPQASLGALRWDALNPWGRFSEKLSTHPLVVRRIAALETSGLPGAPTQWHAAALLSAPADDVSRAAQGKFWLELPVRYVGWISLAAAVLVAKVGDNIQLAAECLVVAGAVLLVRAIMRSPLVGFAPVERVTSLLSRLDASPVTGIAVSIHGRVLGRGMPGYVFSPDLVVADDSGYVPVVYSNPVPLSRTLFALCRAGNFADHEVTVRGWYRRDTGPYLELRDITPATGHRARGWQWIANYLFAVGCLAVGLLVMAATFAR